MQPFSYKYRKPFGSANIFEEILRGGGGTTKRAGRSCPVQVGKVMVVIIYIFFIILLHFSASSR
jgi:hypothetical protein